MVYRYTELAHAHSCSPVDRVIVIWVVLELIGKDAGIGEGTADGEGVSNCSPLWLPPQSQQLAKVVNQPG